MYREVTRTIVINEPNHQTRTVVQTVRFSRDDANGNAGYYDPSTRQTIWNAWHVDGSQDATGTWAQFNAPHFAGYTATPALISAVNNVTADTASTTATINYVQTDASQYDPSYPEVVTTPGRTATTDVQWQNNEQPTDGDATYAVTPGAKVPSWVSVDPKTGKITYTVPANATTQVVNVPVTVTYHDGTTDQATGTVVVVSGKSHVDNPAGPKDVINNPGNLPGGTTVVWTPGQTPDPHKTGNQPTSVTVTVPGQKPVTIPTTVTYPTTPSQNDADKYNPSYPSTVAKPGDSITTPVHYDGDQPSGNVTYTKDPSAPSWVNVDPHTGTITYTVPADQGTGTVTIPVTITYPDGTKDHTTASVVVVSGKQHVTNPSGPSDVINNPGNLPKGTTVVWTPGHEPDPHKTGDQPTSVTVTVPGQKPVTIPTTVTYPTTPSQNDADKYNPSYPSTVAKPGDSITTPVHYDGDQPSGNVTYTKDPSAPSWVNVDPHTGTITYTVPADQGTGTVTIPVTITYPDGTKDHASETVVVVSGKQHVTNPSGPSDVINNPGNLPKGTTVVWTPGHEPDPNKTGDQPASVTITVPGQKPITVPTTVTYTEAHQYQPSYPTISAHPGEQGTANVQWQNNKKPNDQVTYQITSGSDVPAWISVDPHTGTISYNVPANTGSGVYNVPVTVTYHDGSSDQISGDIVVVVTNHHVTNPTSPWDIINNPGNFPAGTTVTWVPGHEPDPNKQGTQHVIVEIHIPGQNPIQVPSDITITSRNNKPNNGTGNGGSNVNNGGNTNNGNGINHGTGNGANGSNVPGISGNGNGNGNGNGASANGSNGLNGNLANGAVANNGTANNGQNAGQKLPQTGNSNDAALLGFGLASLMALLGLGGKKKEDK
ncbi:Rib/alpha-like domain-containing protein [Limosilactobacillus sp.]|uniref:Rib/alpha-like domain-containing protein n=1 Tax=Limosilactobacillus sp. TaxID=2773925 RepID=UPI00345EE548